MTNHGSTLTCLMRRVLKTETCWLWQGSLTTKGYGQFSVGGKLQRTHRASYEAHIGPITGGLHVLHSCDVRHCVNPEHLRLGTNLENMADREASGRTSRGERHATAKLTRSQAAEIKQRRLAGEVARTVAESFGVSKATVYDIAKGKRWAHLP